VGGPEKGWKVGSQKGKAAQRRKAGSNVCVGQTQQNTRGWVPAGKRTLGVLLVWWGETSGKRACLLQTTAGQEGESQAQLSHGGKLVEGGKKRKKWTSGTTGNCQSMKNYRCGGGHEETGEKFVNKECPSRFKGRDKNVPQKKNLISGRGWVSQLPIDAKIRCFAKNHDIKLNKKRKGGGKSRLMATVLGGNTTHVSRNHGRGQNTKPTPFGLGTAPG